MFLTYIAEHGITFEQAAAADDGASSGRNRPRHPCGQEHRA
jgi:hypothetical protein